MEPGIRVASSALMGTWVSPGSGHETNPLVEFDDITRVAPDQGGL